MDIIKLGKREMGEGIRKLGESSRSHSHINVSCRKLCRDSEDSQTTLFPRCLTEWKRGGLGAYFILIHLWLKGPKDFPVRKFGEAPFVMFMR